MTSRRLGIVLATWSTGFALAHAAWALGWRAGVPASVAPITDRPVFLAYDVVAGVLMVAAAVVALRLARGGLTRATRRRLVRLTTAGAALALVRGVPALVVDVVTGTGAGLGPVADTWFVVAGALGLLLARSARGPRGSRRRSLALTARPAEPLVEQARAPASGVVETW